MYKVKVTHGLQTRPQSTETDLSRTRALLLSGCGRRTRGAASVSTQTLTRLSTMGPTSNTSAFVACAADSERVSYAPNSRSIRQKRFQRYLEIVFRSRRGQILARQQGIGESDKQVRVGHHIVYSPCRVSGQTDGEPSAETTGMEEMRCSQNKATARAMGSSFRMTITLPKVPIPSSPS